MCVQEVSMVFQVSLTGDSRKFKRYFMRVARVFQESFKGVSIEGCFKGNFTVDAGWLVPCDKWMMVTIHTTFG